MKIPSGTALIDTLSSDHLRFIFKVGKTAVFSVREIIILGQAGDNGLLRGSRRYSNSTEV